MSQPIPMSRSMMQTLKAEKDEDIRKGQIKKIVNEIYKEAVQIASTNTTTSYNYELPSIMMAMRTPSERLRLKAQHQYLNGAPDPFHIKNIADILAGLRDLFPDCAVSHTLLCQAKDGKMYDVAKLDGSVLPFVDRALDQSYIVIDWS
jgi:hypothetical protein